MTPRVVLYSPRLGWSSPAGIGQYVRELISAIAASHDPSVIEYRVGASPEGNSSGNGAWGLPVKRPPFPRKPLHLAWSLTHRPSVDRFVDRPDLLHVMYPSIPVPSKAKVIYTVHDLMPLRTGSWFGRGERWAFGHAIRFAARRADHLIANSQATAAELTDLLDVPESRITVIPMGISRRFFEPAPQAEIARVVDTYRLLSGRYLLALGAVSTRKNLPVLFHALTQLKTSDAGDVQLAVAGPPGRGASAIRDLARQLKVESSVTFTGWIPPDDLHPLVAGAAAMVHPAFEEGFGMTPLEGMAAGIPVAVSAGGALPETVGDAALLVDPLDSQAWANAITTLLRDEQVRGRLIADGRVRAAQYSWQRVAEETIGVHEACLGERRQSS